MLVVSALMLPVMTYASIWAVPDDFSGSAVDCGVVLVRLGVFVVAYRELFPRTWKRSLFLLRC